MFRGSGHLGFLDLLRIATPYTVLNHAEKLSPKSPLSQALNRPASLVQRLTHDALSNDRSCFELLL